MTDTPKAPLLTMVESDFRRGVSWNQLRAEINAQRAARAKVESERDAWVQAMDDFHVTNWIGIIDGLSPKEAVNKLMCGALDQERDTLKDQVTALEAERDALREQVRALSEWHLERDIPPDSGWYLVFDGRDYGVAYWAMKPMAWSFWQPNRTGSAITRWLPLPAPPTEDR